MARPRSVKGRAREISRRLVDEYPKAECSLVHDSAYQLIVSTVLAAQCTDVRINMVAPEVFRRYPTPADLAHANPVELEEIIRSTGFFRSKARNLIGLATALEERHDGEVPTDLDALTKLPGVGRKTGNVVRSVAFGLPGLPVDTHVGRLSRRLGLTAERDPVKVEHVLMQLLPPDEWGDFSLRLIAHGRQVCDARKPRCEACTLTDICPSSTLGGDGRKRP